MKQFVKILSRVTTGSFLVAALASVSRAEEAAGEPAKKEAWSMGEWLVENLMNHHLSFLPDWGFFTLSKHAFILLLSSLTLAVLAIIAGRGAKKNPEKAPHGLTNAFEVIIKYIRDEVVYPACGEKWGKHLLNYFITLFLFIFFANIAGVFPNSKSPTMNISVTFTMAMLTLILMFYAGIRAHGVWGFMKQFAPPGVPWPVYFILTPIEIVGFFVKPFALTIRLFANMLAGKASIMSFIGLIFLIGGALGVMGGFTLGLLPFLGALGIMILELLVALLQAFIFLMLSALFIGMLAQGHGEEHGGEEHAH